jgi:hypothetical protein
MMRMPDRAEIAAMERKTAQSMQNTRDGVRRVRAAFRLALARPATMLLVAAAAGVAGFCFTRRRYAAPSSAGVRVATATTIVVWARQAIVRYGMQLLPVLLQRLCAAWQKRAV